MMREQNARDPFLGLNAHIRSQVQREVPNYYAVGQVLSDQPLVVRADGMDLDQEDLFIAEHLTAGWTEHLIGLAWPVSVKLPYKQLHGECHCSLSTGDAWVVCPEESVEGTTPKEAEIIHETPLKEGDTVLLLRSPDGQTYYLLERLVKVYDEPISID